MSRAELLAYCLAKPGAWLDEPWEGDQVVKVADKIFAVFGAPDGSSVGLKCGRTSEAAREWRDQYPDDVTVTAYIGRYGWNSFTVGGAVPDDELREAVDASYADVVARLPRSKRPTDPAPG
jgi:predicted DNA-binding protein (MmcQ/YjbR family)